jgi:hypothetical protein
MDLGIYGTLNYISVIAWQTILLVVKIQLPYYYDGRICIWSKIDSNKNDVLKATSGGGFI